MQQMIIVVCFIFFSLFSGFASAGTIYTWTDADGVKRYSNSQPPEDVKSLEMVQEVHSDQADDAKKRQEFDRMAEEAGKEADSYFEEQAQKKAQEEETEREEQLVEQSQGIEEELARLRKAIEDIQNRGLGPRFTNGMKENQIRLVQEKIDQLESDPNAYFKK